MRLEFLTDGSPDCPLIRVFDFTSAEAVRMGKVVADLATGRAERIEVHQLPGVIPKGGCELVLCVRGWDQGVVRIGPTSFECGLTVGTWDNVAGLVEPFMTDASGYQWLARQSGGMSLLLSPSGQW